MTDSPESALAGVRSVLSRLLNLPGEALGNNPAQYRTLGWDSLLSVELIAALEDHFDGRIDDAQLVDVEMSLKGLVAVIQESLQDEVES